MECVSPPPNVLPQSSQPHFAACSSLATSLGMDSC